MNKWFPFWLAGLALPLALIPACSNLPKVNMPSMKIPDLGLFKKEEATVDFTNQIRPILERRCLACHNSQKAERGLVLETRDTANTTWRGGPIIIPGEPEKSMIYQVLLLAPYGGAEAIATQPHQIGYGERKLIFTWIKEGAYWPQGDALAAPMAPVPSKLP